MSVSPTDIAPSRDESDIYILINGTYVVSARPAQECPPGHIALAEHHRSWANIAFTDTVEVQSYDPFAGGPQAYLGSMDVEVAFAAKKTTDRPFDQDELADHFTGVSVASTDCVSCHS